MIDQRSKYVSQKPPLKYTISQKETFNDHAPQALKLLLCCEGMMGGLENKENGTCMSIVVCMQTNVTACILAAPTHIHVYPAEYMYYCNNLSALHCILLYHCHSFSSTFPCVQNSHVVNASIFLQATDLGTFVTFRHIRLYGCGSGRGDWLAFRRSRWHMLSYDTTTSPHLSGGMCCSVS